MTRTQSLPLTQPMLASLSALLLGAPTAHAEIGTINWDTQGRYSKGLQNAPGRFVEVCGTVERHQPISWSFTSDHPTDFYILCHDGQIVVSPATLDASRSAEGRLLPEREHTYCWMWSNSVGMPAQLRLALSRNPFALRAGARSYEQGVP